MNCPKPSWLPIGWIAGGGEESGKSGPSPMDRLDDIMHENILLMMDLDNSRERIKGARAYLDMPGCNARFGEAHLDRCRARHVAILARLRRNRLEALRLLGEGGDGI